MDPQRNVQANIARKASVARALAALDVLRASGEIPSQAFADPIDAVALFDEIRERDAAIDRRNIAARRRANGTAVERQDGDKESGEVARLERATQPTPTESPMR